MSHFHQSMSIEGSQKIFVYNIDVWVLLTPPKGELYRFKKKRRVQNCHKINREGETIIFLHPYSKILHFWNKLALLSMRAEVNRRKSKKWMLTQVSCRTRRGGWTRDLPCWDSSPTRPPRCRDCSWQPLSNTTGRLHSSYSHKEKQNREQGEELRDVLFTCNKPKKWTISSAKSKEKKKKKSTNTIFIDCNKLWNSIIFLFFLNRQRRSITVRCHNLSVNVRVEQFYVLEEHFTRIELLFAKRALKRRTAFFVSVSRHFRSGDDHKDCLNQRTTTEKPWTMDSKIENF